MSVGTVITFYSYKGGVGRTFLLANCAALLARWGFKVLCVDFDLEAPGLHLYLDEQRPPAPRAGLLDLILSEPDDSRSDWKKLVQPVRVPDTSGRLHLLGAGRGDADYRAQLIDLDLPALFKQDLGRRLEGWRQEWTEAYDFVLVDSRTGLTDSQEICTAQLPDLIVAVFTCNDQSLDGVVDALQEADGRRDRLPLDRPGLLVLPIPSRYDAGENPALGKQWLHRFEKRLAPFYDAWRHRDAPIASLLDRLRVNYRSVWTFGERLAVLEERLDDGESTSFNIVTIAALLARQLGGTDELIASRDDFVADVRDRNRALLGQTDRSFAHDVFVSARQGSKVAGLLKHELERRSIDVQAGTKLAAGDSFVALDQMVARCRHLICVIDGPPQGSPWQTMELMAFATRRGQDTDRHIVYVSAHPDQAPPQADTVLDTGLLTPPQIAARLSTLFGAESAAVEAPKHPAPPTQPSARWRSWLRQAHQNLVPFFPGAGDTLLEQVYVELDLSCRDQHSSGPERAQGPLTLATVLADSQPGRWLVIGDPGGGKTTLLRHLAWRHGVAADDAPLVVFLSLARHAADRPDVIDAAVADLQRVDPTAPADPLVTMLRDRAKQPGRLWVFLDGLDEVAPDKMEATRKWITAQAKALPSAHVVVTTRPVALESGGLGRGFVELRVQGLDTDRQRALLDRLLGPDDAGPVWDELQSRPAMAELARNPLLLTLVAIVGREEGAAGAALPSQRVRLYQRVIDLLLRRGHCPEPRGVKDIDLTRRLLRALSLSLHQAGGETWDRATLNDAVWALREQHPDLEARLQGTWQSTDRFLDDIARNAGVLGPHDGPHAPWRFLHRSLREFLAAEALHQAGEQAVDQWVGAWQEADHKWRRTPSSRRKQQGLANPSRWGEVHALLCGLSTRPLALLARLREASPDLARRAIAEVEAVAPEDALGFLLETKGWGPHEVLALVQRWSLPAEDSAELLWQRIRPNAPMDVVAACDWVMEELGQARSVDALLEAWGKASPTADQIPDAVEIPAGSFWMGSSDGQGDPDEHPRHQVTITAGFRLSTTPVTVGQYQAFAPPDGTQSKADLPVTQVTWTEARLYARWQGGRLPTEAEWEYACRAGTETAYWSGDDEKDLAEVGWFGGNSGKQVHPVATKPANPWGLHDMHGNVWEWCADGLRTYQDTAVTDPVGPGGEVRVIRGGSAWDDAVRCRSAYRSWWRVAYRSGDQGFRVVLPPSSAPRS